jgi:CRP-like cAMP-binding protein
MFDSDLDPIGSRDVVRRIDRVLYLRGLPTLMGLETDELQFIAEHLRGQRFKAGEPLLSEGQLAGATHIIVEGRVQVQRDGVILREFGPGEGVGAYGMLSREPEGVLAVALEDTQTLELRADAMRELFEERFSIFAKTLGQMGSALMGERKQIRGNAGFRSHINPGPVVPEAALNLVQRMFCLRQSTALEEAEVLGIAALAKAAEERRYAAGELLWKEDDPSGDLLFLLHGRIGGNVVNPSQEFMFGSGDVVGASSALAGQPRWFTARALDEVVGLSLSTSALIDIFEDHLNLGMVVMSFFARRVLAAFEGRVAQGTVVPSAAASRPNPLPGTEEFVPS